MAEDEAVILSVPDGLVAAFNAHDIDRTMSGFVPDRTRDLPRGPEPHGSRYIGRDEVRRGLMTRFEVTPDVRCDEVGNRGRGPAHLAVAADRDHTGGETVRVCGCDFYTFRNGMVIRNESCWKIVTHAQENPIFPTCPT